MGMEGVHTEAGRSSVFSRQRQTNDSRHSYNVNLLLRPECIMECLESMMMYRKSSESNATRIFYNDGD